MRRQDFQSREKEIPGERSQRITMKEKGRGGHEVEGLGVMMRDHQGTHHEDTQTEQSKPGKNSTGDMGPKAGVQITSRVKNKCLSAQSECSKLANKLYRYLCQLFGC